MKGRLLVSNRRFGLVMGSILLVFGATSLFLKTELNTYLFGIGIGLVLFALIYPKVLQPLNFLWSCFALFNASVIREASVFIVFFFAMTPLGWMMKIMGKDPMSRKWVRDSEFSYWINRKDSLGSMKNQF